MEKLDLWDNIYRIVDITIKLTAGIFIVVYLNNRNNKIKKKEILYNLFLSLIECYQLIYDNMFSSLKYEFYKQLEDKCPTELEHSKNTLIKSLLEENKLSNAIVGEKIFEMFRISETIELILGINVEKNSWSELKYNFMNSLRIPTLILNMDTSEFYDKMLDKIKAFELNYLTEYEAKSELRDEAQISAYKTNFNYRKNKKKVKAYIDEIYRKINNL